MPYIRLIADQTNKNTTYNRSINSPTCWLNRDLLIYLLVVCFKFDSVMNTKALLYLIFLWVFCQISLMAQSTLLFENFDDVSPPVLPEGWIAENNSGTGTTWVTYSVFAYSPPNCVAVFGDWQPKDEWLISPEVSLDAGMSYRVSFYYRTSFSPQKIKVMMGAEQSSQSMQTQLYLNENVVNTTYQEGFAIINTVEQKTVHFGWHIFDSQNNGSIYMDDIKVEEMEAVPEISLSKQNHNFGTISVNETAETTVIITNLGGATLTITETLVEPPFYADFSGTIAPGYSDTLSILFNPDHGGIFAQDLILLIDGEFTGNNVISLNGQAYEAVTGFFEDFEASAELPPGWSSIVQSTGGSAGVTIYQAGQFYNHAFSGEHAARLFNATTDDIIMLITPELAGLHNGQLSFWTKVAVFPEPLIIGSMSDASDHNTFVAYATITSLADYEQHTFTFENAPEDHVYIAFKHGTSSNMRPVFVDDVLWEEQPCLPPPENLTAQSVPGGGVIELLWDAPQNANPLGYNIYRDHQLINPQLVSETEYYDYNIEHGVNYLYYATAVYENGESDPSNEVEHTGDMGFGIIHASAGNNGSIVPEGTIFVGYGDDQVFDILADDLYYIDSLIVDGIIIHVAHGQESFSFHFENVTGEHEIHVEFATTLSNHELHYAISFNVYPNPVTNHLVIALQNNTYLFDDLHCRIYDMNGRLMLVAPIRQNPQKISMTHFPKGYYLLEFLQHKRSLQTFKIEKK
ncbi:MAG: T9SS C-terminal target domain-containing protein [Bacteroidia bacterium]|nr:MAG: T9SS C-terminal target domain-containing protein [Bacteroidia bacterium]